MTALNQRITNFLNEHHVLTLATANNNMPYCANCFYIFLEQEACFVFTTDDNTRHGQEAIGNSTVGGSVVLETNTVGKIQGVQFNGSMYKPGGDLSVKAKKVYLKRFPFARLMKTNLWVVEVDYIKMTDNLLGFGKKLIWEKQKGERIEGGDK